MPRRILEQYARMWPREVFDYFEGGKLLGRAGAEKALDLLNQPGVYILYRDDIPYYIGQAKKLRQRLWHHARPGARYYNFWNFFSAFVIRDSAHRNEIEGILIAAMPTANSKKELRAQPFPKALRNMLRSLRQGQVELYTQGRKTRQA